MTAEKKDERDELVAKDKRIDDLIAEAEKNIASLVSVVDEMKRQTAAQKDLSAGESSGRSRPGRRGWIRR